MALNVGIEVLLVSWAHCSLGENFPWGAAVGVALQLGIVLLAAG